MGAASASTDEECALSSPCPSLGEDEPNVMPLALEEDVEDIRGDVQMLPETDFQAAKAGNSLGG